MDFSYFILGAFTIILRSDDFKRFLGICTYHGISFSRLRVIESEEDYKQCSCRIRCDRYQKLCDIAQKTNVEIEIIKKHGLPVLFNKMKLHIWFFIGAVMALFLLISLSNRIWDISFDGNCYYGNEKLKRFLTEINIKSGMRTTNIHCAELSAMIREAFPRVTWASSEIDGCKLIIHLKENHLPEPEEDSEVKDAYDLVAEKDGIIEEILVRNGIAQVEIGQSVKKGDILISGNIPIMNDAMEVTAYESIASDGDVMIQCAYAYYDELQRKYFVQNIIEEKNVPLIQIGAYRFPFLWLTKPKMGEDTNRYFSEMISEKDVKLTESFTLPFRIGINRQIVYEKTAWNYTDSELKTLANKRFQEFCTNLEKKGVQIYENNVKMELSDVSCTMSGKVTVIEKTGKLQLSEVPEIHGNEMMEE